jgi:hypothetical protein
MKCSENYENASNLIEMKMINSMINFIETYNNQIKNKKVTIKESAIENVSIVLFKTTECGLKTKSPEKKGNKLKKYFDECNKFVHSIKIFQFLVSDPRS